MAAPLNGRTRRVLQRFPYHMEAAQPGKLLAQVTAALVRDQDVQTADMQGIRLAHRLYEARELTDLLHIGALHNISRTELGLLWRRFDLARTRLAALRADASDAELAGQFLALWSLPGEDPLRAFSDDPAGDAPYNVASAIQRLLHSGAAAVRTQQLLDALRWRIATIAAIHRVGNGTVTALLQGAANCLDLQLGAIEHSADRYWHAAPVLDRLVLRSVDQVENIPTELEFLGIEENPQRAAAFGPRPVRHAGQFHLLRKGFEDALLEIRIRGIGQRTISPMLVNRDSGHGVGIFATIPDGVELVFTRGGRATLAGKDVTSLCYAWRGACFAQRVEETGAKKVEATEVKKVEATEVKPVAANPDFVFADVDADPADERTSKFVELYPPGSLDRAARYPHAGDSLPMPDVGIGKTRFAFFVQHGHFAAQLEDGYKQVTPRYGAALADASLFADRNGYAETDQPAAELHLHWLERQAYKVRLFVPRRFMQFGDEPGAESVKDDIKRGIERFRPAGVDIEVQFIDDTWVLNEADLPHAEAAQDNAISRIRAQTILSPVPTG